MGTSYRTSHSAEGYGKKYSDSYLKGYNFYQWEYCEKPLVEELFHNVNEQFDNCRHLDFACGTGRILATAETIFPNSTGVDISASMLEQAQNATTKSILIHQDITKEVLPGEYDIITAFRFFNNAEDSLSNEVLKSLHQNMHERSKLVINIHRNSSGLLALYTKFRRNKGVQGNRFYSYAEIVNLLESTGFKVDICHPYSLLPKLSRYSDKFMLNWFTKFENKIANYFPFMMRFSQCFILVSSKTN